MFVIAGASGHVGSVAASELLDAGVKVRVILHDEKKAEPWKARGAEIHVGSLEDTTFLSGCLAGAQGLFILMPPKYDAPDLLAYEHGFAEHVAAAVQAADVPHVVLLSSIGAELAEGTGPIVGLHDFELTLRETGCKLTAIRATYFQENIGELIASARDQGIVPNFQRSADVSVPMVATRDIGKLVADVLRHPPDQSEVIDLTGPNYSTRQVADKLGAALGKTLEVVDVPPGEQAAALSRAGLPPKLAELLAEMYAAVRDDKLRPNGDRLVRGQTTLDETVEQLLPH